MIVASLLLILVAVTLLVLGLVGGSSSLLISSIVASLLAAVALVIGARQASAARRTAPAADGFGRTDRVRRADFPDDARADDARADLRGDFSADGPFVESAAESLESDRAAAYAAGRHDADEGATGPDVTQRVHPDADLYDDAAAGQTSSGQAAGPASPGPDYDRASSVIGGARSDDSDENAWRREPASASDLDSDSLSPADDALAADGPLAPGGPVAAGGLPAEGGSLADDGLGSAAGSSVAGGGRGDRSGLVDEFDEPDPDDPDDEPLPQAVRPADAVRVARLVAEVLVVDGRPRYHLADCPHLVGRLTEALPVAEAVELGFSPCGLCRPVDRLVAAAAR